jgi:hypothetical protein
MRDVVGPTALSARTAQSGGGELIPAMRTLTPYIRQATLALGPFTSILGPVAAGIAAIVIPAASLTATFLALDYTSRRFMDTISDVPSELTGAKIETNLLLLTKRFERAERFGGQLAQIERLQGRREESAMNITNIVMEPLMPLTVKVEEFFTNLFELLEPIASIFTNLSIKPITDALTLLVGFASQQLEGINTLYQTILTAIDAVGPKWLSQAIRKYLNAKDPAAMSSDMVKEIFESLNLGQAFQGVNFDKNTTFEFRTTL